MVYDNGTAIPDGTEVQLRTSNVQIAPISTLDDPETTDVNEFTTMFGSIFTESAGGNATFFIHGGVEPGTVTLTASAVDPQTNRTSNASFQYTITDAPPSVQRLSIQAETTTLPANGLGLTAPQAFGSIYMTEAEITFRDPLGNFVNPGGEDSSVAVSINPVTVASFSTLDDPETEDINEIYALMGSAPVDMVAGKGTIFIWADSPGTAIITVTALDPYSGQQISEQLQIEVTPSTTSPFDRVNINAQTTRLPSNDLNLNPDQAFGTEYMTEVILNYKDALGNQVNPNLQGQPVFDVSLNPVTVAAFSTLDDPSTADVDESLILVNSALVEASSGKATIFVWAKEPGIATLTVSAVDPFTGQEFTSEIVFEVYPSGVEPIERLSIESLKTTLPANIFNLTAEQALGTVYMTEAEISFRDPLGNYANPGLEENFVSVSINPVMVASFSTLDDPETEDVNEVLVKMGSGPVDMVAGKGTIFLWAGDEGTAHVTVSAYDPFTDQMITEQLEITVRSSNTDLPDSISILESGANYINGSGGSQSQTVQIHVTDAESPIIDPNMFNNVMVDITTDGPNSGESISGIDVNGNQVQGQSIKIDTSNGVASLKLNSGDQPNTVIMTATTDRADNNVDNGLQDPITATKSFVISDGVLFGLDITQPNLGSLFINRVDNGVVNEDGIGNLDGSYSLTISAIATDKGGNPALPQTIQFGLIDSPLVGFPNEGPGEFVISGNDGDPQEGGKQFFAPTGEFLTAAGGVQPGDTLLVQGEEILGNEDLESAKTVQSVQSEHQLTIVERFNYNDLTGTIVNDLDIFPYMIGRAVDGNINATATVDENGVASTEINYPVSKLGKLAAVYAKGFGANHNGHVREVTDVERIIYPGAAGVPGTELEPILVASPNIIPANQPSPISVCFYDAARHPIQGATITWAYVGGNGTGIIDGMTGSGTMQNRTGADGCAYGIAEANGVVTASNDFGFIFSSGGTSCLTEDNQTGVCIAIADPGATYLTATPNAYYTSGRHISRLFLFDGAGQGIPNVALVGTCQSTGGSISINGQIDPTDADGETLVEILAALDGVNEFYTGSCTISPPSGQPSVTITVRGNDVCLGPTSPKPPGCGP
ncbi:hypothetical protein [Marinicella pacifica]|nr:hypothetical protein [Marinicella pacifica]